MIRIFKRLLFVCLCAAPFAGTAQDVAYRLKPLDVIEMRVFQEQDMDTLCKIGAIILPLINNVKVAGLTLQQAQSRIKELYEKDYLVNANVSLYIREYAPQRVYVIGQVNRPGEVLFPPEEEMTLSRAIAGAMGTTRIANLRSLNVKRKMPDKNAKDFPIYDGDTIEVTESII